MKFLLKYLLTFHKSQLIEAIITDYFGSIPSNVSDPAIYILQEKRTSIDKWIAFQSFVLQRKMVNDPKNTQVLYGMLVQLKLMSHMIASGGPALPENVEGTKPASVAQSAREKEESLQKHIEGAETFAKGIQK